MNYTVFSSQIALFAQNPPAGDGGGPPPQFPILLFLVLGLLFYFLLWRPQKTEQKRRESLLTALKKNDRVLTASGIYGVVTNVHREANEVTIKVDEGTNTKLRMTLGSIAQILGDEPPEDSASK